MNPVVHFEIPYEDADRVKKFYQTVFGWDNQNLGPQMGNYILATTTEVVDGRPQQPSAINGGFFQKSPGSPAQSPSVVIAVADIRKAMDKVVAAGGHLLGAPMEIAGIGHYISFIDSEGNRVSMLQPLRS